MLKLGTRRKNRLKRRLITIAIFAAISLIFWLFLRYMTTDRQPPPSYGSNRSSSALSRVA